MSIRFDKIDGFNRIYDGTRYLVLFDSEKYDAIYNKIRYLLSLVESYDSLPIEKRLTLHSVTILIKSVFNKEKNHYHYKIFLEKDHINFYQFLS